MTSSSTMPATLQWGTLLKPYTLGLDGDPGAPRAAACPLLGEGASGLLPGAAPVSAAELSRRTPPAEARSVRLCTRSAARTRSRGSDARVRNRRCQSPP